MGALFLSVFALYTATCYPTIAPRDSADLAVAALTLGPAHPPGYPLYSLLGHAWVSVLPLGDPAYRLNLLSAAAGALAVVMLFSWLLEETGSAVAASGAALGLGFCAPLWKFSLLSEMYSLSALFALILLRLSRGPLSSAPKRAALSGLLLGLGLVNHQALLFLIPALLWLWRGQGRRGLAWLWLLLLGLSLYGAVWLRLGSFSEAFATVTRREYGSLSLFGGFSRPMSPELAGALLRHLVLGLGSQTSPLVAAVAAAGAWRLWRRDRPLAAGLGLALCGFGPIFFLMTRFDLSGWVARSVLETSFLLPAVVTFILAGFGLCALEDKPAAATALALAMAGSVLLGQRASAWHRDDFSAWDYGKDLRRALPPGSTVAAGGDTALFVMAYLERVRPTPSPRKLLAFQDALRGATGYALGLPPEALVRLGLSGRLEPAGLVQRVISAPDFLRAAPAWELSALRRGAALRGEESYARDVLLSYAFAHYLSGKLAEASGRTPLAVDHYLRAAALDAEDYQLEVSRP